MKVSIITACLNNYGTVEQTIESVFGQSYHDIEYIVIDGVSTDGTRDIIARYSGQINRVICEQDCGIYDALNKGIQAATGDVIGFLHADDLYADRTVVEEVVKAFSTQGVDSVYGDLVYVNRIDPSWVIRYWKAGPFDRRRLRCGWAPPHPAFFVKRRVYQEHGVFDLSYRIAADYDLMLRFLLDKGITAAYFPVVLVRMRTGGASNRSLQALVCKSREDLRIIRKHKIRFPGIVLLAKILSKLSQFFTNFNGGC